MDTTERGELLFKLSQLIQEEAETLATIETWDNGMTANSIQFLVLGC